MHSTETGQMKFNVYQPWDPLKVCVVGRSYPPEFYDFIENSRLRELFQRIARETEEDYQGIIATLKKFNVEVIRPNVPNVAASELIASNKRIPGPISMVPRDQMIMVGDKFFVFPYDAISVKASGRINQSINNWSKQVYQDIRGDDWPAECSSFDELPAWVQKECREMFGLSFNPDEASIYDLANAAKSFSWWTPITDRVRQAGNQIIENQYHDILNLIPANGITRIGKDLYFGITEGVQTNPQLESLTKEFFSDYRCHFITTGGHIDGCFTPIKPGLIVSIKDIDTYSSTFPGWEVVYLEGESWDKVKPFLDLKEKNQGKWWIKDHEYDDELIEYVETWLGDWVGYCEESVFDVNILVIDEHNVITSGYNQEAFAAFERHGVTAHVCPFRHRYFWDGGIHCVTLDLHRESTMKDFFPDRGD